MHSLSPSANPHFSLLLAGNAISVFGNSLFLIGLMLYFTTEMVFPLFLGLAQAEAFLPVVLLGYSGGLLVDSVSRPRILATTDMLRGLALGGTALLLQVAERAGGPAAFLLLLCLVVLMVAMQALFQPALISLVTQMDQQSRGTTYLMALRTAVKHLFSLGGQGLGGNCQHRSRISLNDFGSSHRMENNLNIMLGPFVKQFLSTFKVEPSGIS